MPLIVRGSGDAGSTRRRGVAVATGILLLTAGCSGGGPGAPDATGSTEDYAAPPGPTAGPTLPADSPVTDELVGDSISVPWSLAAPVDPDSASLSIWGEGGGCMSVDGAVATETDDTVVVAALGRNHKRPGVECTGDLAFVPITVSLDAPVGEREVHHAYVAEDWNR